MITVTELAQTKLLEYMSQNNLTSPLRIALLSGGWSGASLGLALDEPKSSDEQTNYEGLTFCIDKFLMEQCGDVTVDYLDAGPRSGFSITSANPIGGGGCSSGSCGSCNC